MPNFANTYGDGDIDDDGGGSVLRGGGGVGVGVGGGVGGGGDDDYDGVVGVALCPYYRGVFLLRTNRHLSLRLLTQDHHQDHHDDDS